MGRPRCYRLWTVSEDKLLVLAFKYGMSIYSIAAAHGRSCSAIIQRLGKMGLLYRDNRNKRWVHENKKTYMTYEEIESVDSKLGFKKFRRKASNV